ncbi:MAG: hypothetical protein AB2712_02365 [Candidatus Thiodiazotropha sp.]
MKKSARLLMALLVIQLLFHGCGGGGGGGGDDSGDTGGVVSDNTDTNNDAADDVTGGATGDFDLAAYHFDASLGQVGGAISYESHMHNLQTGDEILAGFENSEQWETIADNTVVFSVNNTGEPSDTFVIRDTQIEDTQHDNDGVILNMTRFVSIGDTYLNEDVSTLLSPDSNISCQVLDHMDSFDISTLTLGMADGVYNDVLHVRCLFTVNQAPLSDVETFYARGIGHVLGIENVGLFSGGPSVVIPLRSGTIYYGSG